MLAALAKASPSAVVGTSTLVRDCVVDASKKSGHLEVPVDLAIVLEQVRRCEVRIDSLWIAAHEKGFPNGPAMLAELQALEGVTERLLSQLDKVRTGLDRDRFDVAFKKASEARDAFRKRVSSGVYP